MVVEKIKSRQKVVDRETSQNGSKKESQEESREAKASEEKGYQKEGFKKEARLIFLQLYTELA